MSIFKVTKEEQFELFGDGYEIDTYEDGLVIMDENGVTVDEFSIDERERLEELYDKLNDGEVLNLEDQMILSERFPISRVDHEDEIFLMECHFIADSMVVNNRFARDKVTPDRNANQFEIDYRQGYAKETKLPPTWLMKGKKEFFGEDALWIMDTDLLNLFRYAFLDGKTFVNLSGTRGTTYVPVKKLNPDYPVFRTVWSSTKAMDMPWSVVIELTTADKSFLAIKSDVVMNGSMDVRIKDDSEYEPPVREFKEKPKVIGISIPVGTSYQLIRRSAYMLKGYGATDIADILIKITKAHEDEDSISVITVGTVLAETESESIL